MLNPSPIISSDNNVVDYLNPNINSSSYPTDDGIIQIDEYRGSEVIDSGTSFNLYYEIDNSIIYFAMEATVTGYVSVGFGSNIMLGSDIIMGYVSGTVETADMIGTGQTFPKMDTIQNLLTSGGTEIGGTTTIEFSRLLDTADSAEDMVINIGSSIDVIWGVSAGDNYISYHSARGVLPITFSAFVPRVPNNVQVVSGDSVIDMSWEKPIDGGSTISQYNIYRSTTIDTGYLQIGFSNGLTYSDDTVINSQQYFYKIAAVNAIGESIQSNSVSAIPSQSVTQPNNVNSTSGDGFVKINWSEPINDGGFSVVEYQIYRSNISGEGYKFLGINDSTHGYLDTDVINGYIYYYVIIANNSITVSGFSNEVVGEPVGRSSVPLNLRITPGNNSAFLNWTSPKSDGGFPILSYNIYRADISDGTYSLIGTNSTNLGYNDTSVINLGIYYYAITGINFAGESDFSISVKIKIAKVPFSVSNITTYTGDEFIQLSWEIADGNGFPILRSYIYRSINDGGAYNLIGNVTDSTFNDTNVINGEIYYYVISSINENGEGVLSQQIAGISGAVPSEPRNVAIVITVNSLLISWREPFDNGGHDTLQYHVYRRLDGENQSINLYSGLNNPYEDFDILAGEVYYYMITAENVIGESLISDVVSAVYATKPSAPKNLQLSLEDESITGIWDIPDSNGGYVIIEYRIYRSTTEQGTYSYVGVNNTILGFSDDTAIPGIEYYYKITAVNALGESFKSDLKSIVLLSSPTSPRNLIGISSNQQAGLSWMGPAFNGGLENITYQVYRSEVDDTNFTIILTTLNTSYIDSNLTNGVSYYYVVTAINEIGESQFSNQVVVIPEKNVVTIPSTTSSITNSTDSQTSRSKSSSENNSDELLNSWSFAITIFVVGITLISSILVYIIRYDRKKGQPDVSVEGSLEDQ